MDVLKSTHRPLRELALFAGGGGGILGGKLLGWRTIGAVEIDPYAAGVLVARQNDGHLQPFPIWDDICTFDGFPWRGIVDVISGGFPCQDISSAGTRKGLDGERSGLWREMSRIVGEVRPRFVFVENSSCLVHNGLDRVLKDLSGLGYDAKWGVFSAQGLGTPHVRKRLFLLAHPPNEYGKAWMGHWTGRKTACWNTRDAQRSDRYFQIRMETESVRHGMANGLAHRVDRLRAIGNGQVPAVAAFAWNCLVAM